VHFNTHGALRRVADIYVRPGETVITATLTGWFGCETVRVAAAAPGAKVIAIGRNPEALKIIKSQDERIETVPLTGDMEAGFKALKKVGIIGAFFSISPPATAWSTHFKSCISSPRPGGCIGPWAVSLETYHFPMVFFSTTCSGERSGRTITRL
jgi:hypothetical protein